LSPTSYTVKFTNWSDSKWHISATYISQSTESSLWLRRTAAW